MLGVGVGTAVEQGWGGSHRRIQWGSALIANTLEKSSSPVRLASFSCNQRHQLKGTLTVTVCMCARAEKVLGVLSLWCLRNLTLASHCLGYHRAPGQGRHPCSGRPQPCPMLFSLLYPAVWSYLLGWWPPPLFFCFMLQVNHRLGLGKVTASLHAAFILPGQKWIRGRVQGRFLGAERREKFCVSGVYHAHACDA